MTPAQLLLAHAVKVLLLLAIVGVLAQGRHRLCWSFLVYLLAVLTGNCLVSFWPQEFYAGWFWMLKQAVYDLAKLAVALDLAHSAFRAFPGARATARFVLFCILAVATAAIIGVPATAPFSVVVAEWHPRILSGTIWLLTATAVLVVWYRLPVHAFQRAVLLGFTSYLLVFSTVLNVLRDRGWDLRPQANDIGTLAYAAVTAWWAYAAWRSDEKIAIAPEVLRRLQMEHLA